MFKILGIHGTNGVYKAIRYLGDKSTPAHTTLTANGRATPVSKGTSRAKKIGTKYYLPNQNGIYHRNLANWGINLTGDNIHSACKDANSIIRLKKHKLRGLQLIISPQKRLNIHDSDQIYRFQQFVTGVIDELYGKDYASYCAIQCDNSRLHSPHMHAHIMTINTNMRNHKSIKGKTYSVANINTVIDHQIDIDNKRHPGHPIFTKHNISTNKLEALKTNLTNNDNIKLINHATNKVFKPGYTVTNRQGQKRNVSSNNMFKYAMKKQGVEPYFKRHKRFYHDRDGNRVPVVKNGKVEHTKRGAVKYKYYLKHGLVYRIMSDKKHNTKLNASDVAKLYPNCSYQYVHAALHRNYVHYLTNHHNNRNARIKYDIKQMKKHRKPSPEYKRIHVYHPTDVRDVMPNLRNPIKHELYNDLHEIEPVMAVHKKQGQHLKRTQHLYMTRPNTIEKGMIKHYRNNLFSRFHRKYDKIKKRASMYKTAMVNSFKNEANKAGTWLQRHHLRNVGSWIVKKVTQKKNIKKINVFNRKPLTMSNQLATQTGNPYSKNVELAKKIEANNSRILNKPAITENDITNKSISIDDVFRGLHSNKAREAFYIRNKDVVPQLNSFEYHNEAKQVDHELISVSGFNFDDIKLINHYYHNLRTKVDKKIHNIDEPVFNHYSSHKRLMVSSQLVASSDVKRSDKLIRQYAPNWISKDVDSFIFEQSPRTDYKYRKLLTNMALRVDKTNHSFLINSKPALKVYKHDRTSYHLKQMHHEFIENRAERERSRERQRSNQHNPKGDGSTLG